MVAGGLTLLALLLTKMKIKGGEEMRSRHGTDRTRLKPDLIKAV